MKTSNKTKNVRLRFFRSTRRRLDGLFGPLAINFHSVILRRPTFVSGYPPIYTAPVPQKQGVKGK